LIIGIDVDGVIRNFHDRLILLTKMKMPEILLKEEIDHYYYKGVIDADSNWFRNVYNTEWAEQLFLEASPFPSNVFWLEEEINRGEHEFWCISAQWKSNESYTLQWLGKHHLNFSRVIFCSGRKKASLGTDILVDDSVENLEAWKKDRGMSEGFILMDAPHNRTYDYKNRIYKLHELEKYTRYTL
tara:strand:- start:45 stop:599 length:555 start_codon:yes stop_codon:yes gene_type:complete